MASTASRSSGINRRSGGGPLRAVTKAGLRGGGSILASFKFHWWELELECGHTVDRRCRYRPDPNVRRRGWAAMHHGPDLDRLIDAPKRVRCEECG